MNSIFVLGRASSPPQSMPSSSSHAPPGIPRCGCRCKVPGGMPSLAWGSHRKYHSYFEGHWHFLCGYWRRGRFRQRKRRENQSGARCSPQGLEEMEAGRRGISWPGPVETVPHGALALRSVGAVRARPRVCPLEVAQGGCPPGSGRRF